METYIIKDPISGTEYEFDSKLPPTAEQVKAILTEGRKSDAKYKKEAAAAPAGSGLAAPAGSDPAGTVRGSLGPGASFVASPYDEGAQAIQDRRESAGLVGLSDGDAINWEEYHQAGRMADAAAASGESGTLGKVLAGVGRNVEGVLQVPARVGRAAWDAARLLVLGDNSGVNPLELAGRVGSFVAPPYAAELARGADAALPEGGGFDPVAGGSAFDAAMRRLWHEDPVSFGLQALPVAAGVRGALGAVNKGLGTKAAARAEVMRAEAVGMGAPLAQGDLTRLAAEVRDSAIGSGWSPAKADTAARTFSDLYFGKELEPALVDDLGQLIGRDAVERLREGGRAASGVVAGARISASDLIGLPKGFKAGFDLSPMLRQGAPLAPYMLWKNPRGYVGAWVDMFKSAQPGDFVKGKGEVNYRAAKAAIEDNLHFTEARDSGLRLSGWDGNEVGLGGQLVGKIPGLGMSERGFNAGLDRLRIEAYSAMRKAAGPKATRKDLNDIADFVNIATGWGNPMLALEGAQGAALKVTQAAKGKGLPGVASASNRAVNTLERLRGPLEKLTSNGLFSARNTAARFQYLDPVRLGRMSPAARKQAAAAMVAHAAGVGVVMGASAAAGATVSSDFTKGDFGKIKFGNTRYEVTGGNARQIRLMLALGAAAFGPGKKEDKLEDMKNLLGQYFRNSMAPIPGAASDQVNPQFTPVGAPETAKERALDLITPLMAKDIYEGWQLEGAKGAAKTLPGVFGVGVQQYESKIYSRRGRSAARRGAAAALDR